MAMEARVTYLEKSLEDQRNESRELRQSVRHLDQKVDVLGGTLSSRIDALDHKVDRFREELSGRVDALGGTLSSRIDALDHKVDRFREELSGRVNALDQKADLFRKELSDGILALDRKVSSQFKWLVGLMVGMCIALLARR
jgi:chromosome segregation ATPase